VTDFLDEKRQEIADRLAELKPLVDEFQRLEAAAAALVSVGGSSSSTTAAPRRRPGRPRRTAAAPAPAAAAASSAAKPAASGRRGRRPAATTRKRAASGRAASSSAASSSAAATPRRRPGRRKGSGTRSVQALSLVQSQPGITIPELAARMGIKQNYLYRVLPGLEQEGKVAKQGRGWHAKKG
jgi:hypothetical protein